MKHITLLFLLVIFTLVCCKKVDKDKSLELAPADYSKIGIDIALSTKAQLGKNLIGAIQKEGTINALEFCNINAFPLTDSMAKAHKATIKRVTDRPRNPNNQANAIELNHIKTFKSQISEGKKTEPIVEQKGAIVHFYAPIITNQLCLQCHGTPETEIKPDVLKVINSLYTKDIAKGYGLSEVRGIWSIELSVK